MRSKWLAGLLAWSALSGCALAQTNLNGTWSLDQPPEWKAAAQAAPWTEKARADNAAARKFADDNHFIMDERDVKCWPPGMPVAMAPPYGIHFLQTPERLAILPEVSTVPRMVYMTETSHHLDSISPSWNGHSIGRWEGEVLVIDTVGFNGRGARITPKGHIVERVSLTDGGSHMVIETTIEDPDLYTRPFTYKTRYVRSTGEGAEYIEYGCEVIQQKLEAYNAALRKSGVTPLEPRAFD